MYLKYVNVIKSYRYAIVKMPYYIYITSITSYSRMVFFMVALLAYYEAISGNFLPTFPEFKNPGWDG